MREKLPSLADAYTLLLELGRGGMGVVYLARMQGVAGFERFVVIKRMHAELTADPRQVDRFVDEARIASHVHHANVVGVQHVGEDEQGYFLVLDYVEGEALDRLCDALTDELSQLPYPVIARIFLDALAGLESIHAARDATGAPLGILHRDISPQNLLVGIDGVTRIMDFGIAKSHANKGRTKTGAVVGKALYMAPEYLTGRPFGQGIDVYALGVSLWVTLAGRDPWPGAEEPQILVFATTEGVPHLLDVAPEVPAALAEVAMCASSADPAFRYPTAREMAAALQQAVGAEVASSAEVADVVRKHFGDAIAARRRSPPLSRKSAPLILLEPEARKSPVPAPSTPPSAAAPVTIATDDFAVLKPRRPPALVIGGAIAGVIGVAAIGAMLFSGKSSDPVAPPSATAASAPPSASVVAPPAATTPPAEPSAVPPPPEKSARTKSPKPPSGGPPPPGLGVPTEIKKGNPYR